MKKLFCLGATLLLAFLLSACSNPYDKTFYSETDYVAPVQQAVSGSSLKAANFAELKAAVLKCVNEDITDATIVFSESYNGDVSEDMASACWNVRTQDALCAFCVENISYEITNIVSHAEVSLHISYSDLGGKEKNIEKMQYITGLNEMVADAIRESKTSLVILVERTAYNAADIEDLFVKVYDADPSLSPVKPDVNISSYNGVSMQRLFDISIEYSMSADELGKAREIIRSIVPIETEEAMTDTEKLWHIAEYFAENCKYTEEEGHDSVYSALVEKNADSRGLSLALVELCGRYGIDSRIIYGTCDRDESYWNLVNIDGRWYHLDIKQIVSSGLTTLTLKNDSAMWGTYRWDVSEYPACAGENMQIDTDIIMRRD